MNTRSETKDRKAKLVDSAAPAAHPEKAPELRITGDEPMTGLQASYRRTLSQEAGEAFDETPTKAAASRRIEELQRKTGRGTATR